MDDSDMLLSCLLQDKEGGNVMAGGLVKFISTLQISNQLINKIKKITTGLD